MIACASVAALKTGSSRKTWLASTSVRPLAAVLRFSSRQRRSASCLKAARVDAALRSPLSRTDLRGKPGIRKVVRRV